MGGMNTINMLYLVLYFVEFQKNWGRPRRDALMKIEDMEGCNGHIFDGIA